MERYRIGLLGATGLVGQRLLSLLGDHPWFEVGALAASPRSEGRTYGDTASWGLTSPIHPRHAAMKLLSADADEMLACDLIFSMLPSVAAERLEPQLVDRGAILVSNASTHRMDSSTPLLMPEVNPEQLDLVAQRARDGSGFLITNPNCSVTGLVLSLAPVWREFGVEQVQVTTMQAVSGAGLAGAAAMQLIDNILPSIAGEEEKLETEPCKILGQSIAISAQCNRVPVVDGHLMTVAVRTGRECDPDEVIACMRRYRVDDEIAGLPSALAQPVRVRDEDDRPQPRLDRDLDGGMGVVVGLVRRCPVLGVKWTALCHNTLRGAAGGALLNAELLAQRGLLSRRKS